jgi:membrane-associated phospholipid phosphatase
MGRESELADVSRPSGRCARPLRTGNLWIVVGLFALLAVLVLYLDSSVKNFVLSMQGRWGLQVATWVSSAGYGLVNAAIAAAILAAGIALGRPREALAGRLGLFAVILGGLSVQIPKHLFCRSRPLAEGAGQFFTDFPCIGKGSWLRSFPSGHSVTAFALAYVLARLYPKASPVFYGLAAMVAFSRVYLASHFLSDIVAGAAFGLLAGWVVCRLAAPWLGNARV